MLLLAAVHDCSMRRSGLELFVIMMCLQLEKIEQAAKKRSASFRKPAEKGGRARKSPVKLEAYEAASPSGEGDLGDTPLMSSLRGMKAEGAHATTVLACPNVVVCSAMH